MKLIGVGSICERHSDGDEAETQLCRFPDAITPFCHQCGWSQSGVIPAGLENAITFCSDKCSAAWESEHPGYWTPIEETLPGGRHDGIWENSGFEFNK